MEHDLKNIVALVGKFNFLNLSEIMDFDKFNLYAITHHSTTIEGSTLTEVETRLLLDEGITPAGKPLMHSLMVQDHYHALQFVLSRAKEKVQITSAFICKINAEVLKHTGSVYNTIFGEVDASKGMFRKGNVSAGNSYFVNYDKVEMLVKALSEKIQERLSQNLTFEEQLKISFDAHYELVSIHPFYDGNGRTSRLLMNFIQEYYSFPPAIVFKEDKAAYFEALIKTRQEENIDVFRSFMYTQYEKYLEQEIEKFTKLSPGKSTGYTFLL